MKICKVCGFWSYERTRCYHDRKILSPLPKPKKLKRGTQMTSPSGIEFVWIPAGSFMMGSPPSEVGRFWNEGPQRLVTIERGFWMGRYPVTEEQYYSISVKEEFIGPEKELPRTRVTWKNAKRFVTNLNERNDGLIYSLPTEAEWEYSARAGTTTPFAFGKFLSITQANFLPDYQGDDLNRDGFDEDELLFMDPEINRVGSYKPNAWGVYDMHGTVYEWVEDYYKDNYRGLRTDGSANTKKGFRERRVVRGGAYCMRGARYCRSANRGQEESWKRNEMYGFRVVARAL